MYATYGRVAKDHYNIEVMYINIAITLTHMHSASLDNIKRPQLYGFRGLNIMGDRNYINYPRDSSNGMESRFKP